MLKLLARLLAKFHRRDPVSWLVRQGLTVGHNFAMLEDVIIDPSHMWHIVIGNDVTLAPRVQILAHDASAKRHLGRTRIGKVVIGDRVFVGASSIILPGVTIGSDVIIGAGSIVTGDIPGGVVAAGNPARVLCPLAEFLERRTAEMASSPDFGIEYTIRGNITEQRKAEMNARMKNRYGYVV
ncbi:MAG: DapH/DapD/GlmU-related protein [Nitrospirota bacterium]